jgi:starch phosphorylase
MYDKLEYAITPMFYRQPTQYAAVMRSAISINGSFFSAQRMMLQYYRNVYMASGEGFAA